jgi:hypothetical protein
VQSQLGHEILQNSTPRPKDQSIDGDGDDGDESDAGTDASELIDSVKPQHLQSLFQNDWLSAADSGLNAQKARDRKASTTTTLLDRARLELQRLIPSKDECIEMSKTASVWLNMASVVLPPPHALKTQQELLGGYDMMRAPTVDPMDLAGWLLDLAITARQEPENNSSPGSGMKRFYHIADFCRAVSATVESALISHDSLMGSISALTMSIHYLRL